MSTGEGFRKPDNKTLGLEVLCTLTVTEAIKG